ncbi:MAG: hypothetical protein E7675_08055 [Ruminococcaceae bacterium]|nr:hypothetical protein [Oscillospiraceae bacterium]
MGKQVNYIMYYEAFVKLAEFALELGCMIVPKGFTDEPEYPKCDISVVTSEKTDYYFYIPELFPIDQIKHGKNIYGKYYLEDDFGMPFAMSIIEASYSENENCAARVYVQTGYYDENENWIPRSEKLTKTYEKIARRARKLAERIV